MTFPRNSFARRARPTARGFSLVEVLLAIFILGIGMIMVASIFPVGANWTRQATEETVGQAIAQNAVSVLEQHYGPRGTLAGDIAANSPTNTVRQGANPFVLQSMPGFTKIPLDQRSYQFGSTTPFPAPNPANCTYFWTALCRLNPSQQIANAATNNVFPAPQYKYDVYILVFRKGDPNHNFNADASGNLASPPVAAPWVEPAGMRTLPAEVGVPYVISSKWQPGTYSTSANPPVVDAIPPVGTIGIGRVSGTVFRQGFDPINSVAVPRPTLSGTTPNFEDVFWAPGPNNIGGINAATRDGYYKSPLIYVYQTTLTL